MDAKSETALKIAQQAADAAKLAYEKGLTTVGYMLELTAAQAYEDMKDEMDSAAKR